MDNAMIIIILTSALKAFKFTATDKGEYVRVWNPYCGASAGRFTSAIQTACENAGLKWTRRRTAGSGMISAADWEDRVSVA